jgi:hypothetical protein
MKKKKKLIRTEMIPTIVVVFVIILLTGSLVISTLTHDKNKDRCVNKCETYNFVFETYSTNPWQEECWCRDVIENRPVQIY